MDLMWERIVWEELEKVEPDAFKKAGRFHDLRVSPEYKELHDRFVNGLCNEQVVVQELAELLAEEKKQ